MLFAQIHEILEKGCLFIALQGDNFDAHQFVDAAQQAGAKVMLVHQQISLSVPTCFSQRYTYCTGIIKCICKNLKFVT